MLEVLSRQGDRMTARMGVVFVRPRRTIRGMPVVVMAMIAAMPGRFVRMPVIKRKHATAEPGDHAERQQP